VKKEILLKYFPLGLLLFVICLWSAYQIRLVWIDPKPLGGDEADYNSLAQSILAGNGFALSDGELTAWRTPGFPFILAGIYFLFGTDITHARLVLILFTAVTGLVLYFFADDLLDNRYVSALAGICYLLSLNTLQMATQLYGENTAGLVLLLAFWCVSKMKKKPSVVLSVIAGSLMGLAVLNRGYLLLLIFVPFLWLLRTHKQLAISFLLVTLVLIGGWVVRNRIVMGIFTLSTQPAQEMWCGNNAWARGAWPGEWAKPSSEQRKYLEDRTPGFNNMSEVARSRIFQEEFIYEVMNNPQRIIRLIPRKIAIYLGPGSAYFGTDWIYAVLIPFVIVGVIVMGKKASHYRQILWFLGGPILGVMVVCILTFGDSRFRQPIAPLIFSLASFGIFSLLRQLSFINRVLFDANQKVNSV
jgi:4-amino-4-deoxy-L-arabinose transferase-like glycosyltransferase